MLRKKLTKLLFIMMLPSLLLGDVGTQYENFKEKIKAQVTKENFFKFGLLFIVYVLFSKNVKSTAKQQGEWWDEFAKEKTEEKRKQKEEEARKEAERREREREAEEERERAKREREKREANFWKNYYDTKAEAERIKKEREKREREEEEERERSKKASNSYTWNSSYYNSSSSSTYGSGYSSGPSSSYSSSSSSWSFADEEKRKKANDERIKKEREEAERIRKEKEEADVDRKHKEAEEQVKAEEAKLKRESDAKHARERREYLRTGHTRFVKDEVSSSFTVEATYIKLFSDKRYNDVVEKSRGNRDWNSCTLLQFFGLNETSTRRNLSSPFRKLMSAFRSDQGNGDICSLINEAKTKCDLALPD